MVKIITQTEAQYISDINQIYHVKQYEEGKHIYQKEIEKVFDEIENAAQRGEYMVEVSLGIETVISMSNAFHISNMLTEYGFENHTYYRGLDGVHFDIDWSHLSHD